MSDDQRLLEKIEQSKVIQDTSTRLVRDLIADLTNAKIRIPDYQRTFVWDSRKQCRFIESIFINIPTPPIFLLEKFDPQTESTIYEIIDGVQRLTTIANFVNGILRLSSLQTLTDLNQASFSSLSTRISNIFWDRKLYTTIIDEKNTHPAIQFEVFGRLNQGSVSLNAQELRNCIFHGEFNNLLIELSKLPTYRKILNPFSKFATPKQGNPDKSRMQDIELILRFFTLIESYDIEKSQYPESREETLNSYMRKRIEAGRECEESDLMPWEHLESLLTKTLDLVRFVFKGNHFRSFIIKENKDSAGFSPSLNQSVFDVQMLGLADLDFKSIQDKQDLIYELFLDLSSYNKDFIDAVLRSTNSKVSQRVRIWKQELEKLLDEPEPYFSALELKKDLFSKNPVCYKSGKEIKSIDEADIVDGNLYHRCFSPSLDKGIADKGKTVTRQTINTPVQVAYRGNNLNFEDVQSATQAVISMIANQIKGNAYEVNRIMNLGFVGSVDDILETSTHSIKSVQELRGIQSSDGQPLYIETSGGRQENLDRLKKIAGLFSFMEGFAILD